MVLTKADIDAILEATRPMPRRPSTLASPPNKFDLMMPGEAYELALKMAGTKKGQVQAGGSYARLLRQRKRDAQK